MHASCNLVLFLCRWNIIRNTSRRLRARPALMPVLQSLLWPKSMQITSVRWHSVLLHIRYIYFTSYVVTSSHMLLHWMSLIPLACLYWGIWTAKGQGQLPCYDYPWIPDGQESPWYGQWCEYQCIITAEVLCHFRCSSLHSRNYISSVPVRVQGYYS